jgi:hypothetical protein
MFKHILVAQHALVASAAELPCVHQHADDAASPQTTALGAGADGR